MIGCVRRTIASPVTVIALLVALAFGPAPATATPGDLDPTFSTDGKAVTGFPEATVGYRTPALLAVAPEGKSLMATTVNRCRKQKQCSRRAFFYKAQDLGVVRYTRDGQRDGSFSDDGRVILTLPGTQSIAGVAVQEDGKTLLAGTSGNDILLARLTRQGKLDRSFADAGLATVDSGLVDQGAGVEVRPDGGIVVAGSFGRGPDTPEGRNQRDFVAAVFTPAGELDPSFSGDGIATVDFRPPESPEAESFAFASGMTLKADGGVVIAGEVSISNAQESESGLAIASLTADGQPDPAFGTSGEVVIGSALPPLGVAVDPFGSVVTATATGSFDTSTNFLISRFDRGGSLDPSFAGDGMALIDGGGGEELTDAVTVQPDGSPVFTGSSDGARNSIDYALVRLTPQGEADPSFAEDGKLTVEFEGDYDDADGIELQGDGRIVVAGTVGDQKIGITRHEVAPGPPDFDADGIRDFEDRCPDRFGQRRNGCPSRAG